MQSSTKLLTHRYSIASLSLVAMQNVLSHTVCEMSPTADFSSQVSLLSQWTSPSEAHQCCAGKDLATIGQQFPFEPLQYQTTNLRLPFQEGIKMLQEAGWDVSQHT